MIGYILLIIVILIIFNKNIDEGFTDYTKKIDEIINNKELFKTNFYNTRKQLTWIDPIIYEDVRILQKDKNLSKESLINVFN